MYMTWAEPEPAVQFCLYKPADTRPDLDQSPESELSLCLLFSVLPVTSCPAPHSVINRWLLPLAAPPCPVGWRTAWDPLARPRPETPRLLRPLPHRCCLASHHATCPTQTVTGRRSARWPLCGAVHRRTSPGTPRPPAPPAELETPSPTRCDAEWPWSRAGTGRQATTPMSAGGETLEETEEMFCPGLFNVLQRFYVLNRIFFNTFILFSNNKTVVTVFFTAF